MQLEILTPESTLYTGEVYGVQLPGINGLFEVLDRHAAIVSALKEGNLKVLTDANNSFSYRIKGGFVEVSNNKASVLVEGGEQI